MISCLMAYMTQLAAMYEHAEKNPRRSLRSLLGF